MRACGLKVASKGSLKCAESHTIHGGSNFSSSTSPPPPPSWRCYKQSQRLGERAESGISTGCMNSSALRGCLDITRWLATLVWTASLFGGDVWEWEIDTLGFACPRRSILGRLVGALDLVAGLRSQMQPATNERSCRLGL